MGSLAVVKDGNILYARRHRLRPDQRNREKAFDDGEQVPDRFDHENVHATMILQLVEEGSAWGDLFAARRRHEHFDAL
jgi:hypothetical protein